MVMWNLILKTNKLWVNFSEVSIVGLKNSLD